MTLLPKGSWERYSQDGPLVSCTDYFTQHNINLVPMVLRGKKIIAKEDLLTASCDSFRPLPGHHVLAYRSIHTPEISVRNTWSKEYVRR